MVGLTWHPASARRRSATGRSKTVAVARWWTTLKMPTSRAFSGADDSNAERVGGMLVWAAPCRWFAADLPAWGQVGLAHYQ
jgi:hypothetical protein